MKFQIMVEILFVMLAKRKVSARELAEKFDISFTAISTR